MTAKGLARTISIGLLLLLLGILAARYLLGAFLPFLLAWATAAMLRPLTDCIRKTARVPSRAAGFAALFLLLALIGGACVWLIAALVSQAGDLGGHLSENLEEIVRRLGEIGDAVMAKLGAPDSMLRQTVSEAILNSIRSLLSELGAALPSGLGKLLSQIPGILLFLTVYLLSAFSLCMRREPPGNLLYRHLPQSGRVVVERIRAGIKRVGLSYLRATGLLFLFTFLELAVGLMLLGIPYALVLALLIALVDLLPVLGCGSVLAPWSAACFLLGDSRLGIGLAILLLAVTLLRRLIEPRVLGKSIGLSPLLTLTSLYAGWYLFGIGGMLLLPAILTLLLGALKKDAPETSAPSSTPSHDRGK